MLFCKPSLKNEIIYERSIGAGQQIGFRPLILSKDLNILYQWVNQPYAKFWQLEGSKQQLESVYRTVLRNPDAHSFVGSLDAALICQIDVYRVQAADLGKFISCQPHDCGLHFLMAPTQSPVNGLSRMILQTFIAWYFSFNEAACLYAEPDIHNHKACRLLERTGFRFLRNIMLSDKAASLYIMTKQSFHATYPDL